MKLFDLSHELSANTPIYPGDAPTTLSTYKVLEQDHYNAYLLQSGLHTATHIDIPMHLLPDERTADMFNIEHFIGNGVLLDVRGEQVIQMKSHYEQMISPGDIVLLYTAFDTHYFEEDIYFHQHPVVADEFASFLIARKIKMLGIDMPAPDYFPFNVHKALLAKDIFVLENLTNLQNLLHVPNFEVIALPLKIKAEASFVRAVARVWEGNFTKKAGENQVSL